MNNFFKHNDKVYSENLNDGILVGNSFDWTVNISLPGDTGGVFPNSTTVVKAKVADVYATPNSNLSIGDTISNASGSSQVYRLTVYPSFNRFGGFTFVSLEGDGSVIITEKGGTSPVRNNLDYANLGNVAELKTLKEYDIVVTIPSGGEVTGLGFGFKSSSADVTASINQSNVTGLVSDLSGIRDDLSSLESGKANKVHNHSSSDVKESSALSNIGTSANALQSVVNGAVNGKVGSLSTSISNNLSKINTLSTEVWNNTTQTGTSRIDSLEGSVSSLSTSVSGNLSKINTLNTEVWGSNTQTGNSRIDVLVNRTASLESSVTSLDTSITNIGTFEKVAENTTYELWVNTTTRCARIIGHRTSVTIPAGEGFNNYGDFTIPSTYYPKSNVFGLIMRNNQFIFYLYTSGSYGIYNLGNSVSNYNFNFQIDYTY